MTSLQLPRLRLLVGVEPPDGLRRLLLAAADLVTLSDATDAEPMPSLWYRDVIEPSPELPYAVWAADTSDLNLPQAQAAPAVVTDNHDVADAAGERAVFVAAGEVIGAARLILPASRRRLRAARGLPATLVLRAEGESWAWYDAENEVAIPADLHVTALAVASAGCVTGEALGTALAWGAATVTDSESAGRFRAVDGVHTIVEDDATARLYRACALAEDVPVAAQLGQAGRQLVERRHDLAMSVTTLLQRLGLEVSRAHPRHAIRGLLADLHTPVDSPIRWRVASLLQDLPSIGDLR